MITHAKSNKMAQLALNPNCAISCEWFSAQGMGESMGWFGLAKNADIADRLRAVFAEWIDNGHNDLDSTDCIILKIRLTSGILYADGVRHEIMPRTESTIRNCTNVCVIDLPIQNGKSV